ncbi:LysR family transcriptional regulator [Asanoa iriomotensis]|uniref:LysR family transcriptional regulator n=1 Tax=Asanoa iriomotensis TaxID=234613 RepID=A0ABQ4BUK6_9ACTN|nr:LysR substrate-binding domain-containing protein [Asanoa iriomotensis]GIF54217.1 LysR family transcriptional regulator [Asanoa iriomotensis]
MADLETVLLRAFLTAARAGSIGRAAVALGHSQPAVSQQLRKLERAVGQELLQRSTAGVVLTKAGETLLPYAERILTLAAQALRAPGEPLTGHCGIGLTEDLAAAGLPQALADFARMHPGATLEIVTGPGPAVREAFDSGRVQLALTDPADLAEPPRWTVRRPLTWVAHKSVDLTADPLPLVLFSEPGGWRAPLLAALDAADRPWRVAFESTSLAGVQAAVRAGLGVAALLPANVEPGTAVDGLPALPGVEIGIVRRPDTEEDPLADAVEGVLRRVS